MLDAIGNGAHRVSEIGGRIGRPATSLSRPLERLVGMGLIRREVPFGESEKQSRRSLYRIDDPFLRLWFRIVAPHRGALAAVTPAGRLAIARRHWPDLAAAGWEDMCRLSVPRIPRSEPLGRLGPRGPVSRWWLGSAPEWDLVAESLDGKRLLLGEAKWSARPVKGAEVEGLARHVSQRPGPELATRYRTSKVARALFVPAVDGRPPSANGVLAVTAESLLAP